MKVTQEDVVHDLPRAPLVVKAPASTVSSVRLSVVIPNFNTAAFVRAAVESALQQTMPDLEVVVVDDGSTDTSLSVLSDIDDSRLTVLHQPNRGLAGARNTGIRASRGTYIGFLDSDDTWAPQKADTHLRVMEQDSAIGLSFSFSEYLLEDGAKTGQLLVTRNLQPSAHDLIARNHVGNGSTPVVRKECFALAGLFDETLWTIEDQEMWVRIAARGFKVVGIPQVLTGYRIRRGSISVTYERFLASAREATHRFKTHVPSVSASLLARSYAEALRIASRKALFDGRYSQSRALLWRAVRVWPLLVTTDARAIGMTVFHLLTALLPEAGREAVFSAGLRVMRIAYAGVSWKLHTRHKLSADAAYGRTETHR